MNNPFLLTGKKVLVTGASSGIGRTIAVECSKIGAKVIITGRNQENLHTTYGMLDGEGHDELLCDLQIEEQLDALVDRVPELDGVVHCAGIVSTLPFEFITRKKLDDIFNVNFVSPTVFSRMLVKNKKISCNASIVWISSIAGTIVSSPAKSMYGATKGAVNGMMKGMAIDLAPKKIRVNAVLPGMIETRVLDEGQITTEQFEEDKKKYPLKRYGKPEDVAFAVIYLLSDASSWVTGSSIIVDGGVTLQ
jgi:NAD(P)-dependent dehydrogenase (short-subunit alcohol dehydrogenase family)